MSHSAILERAISITAGDATLHGDLAVPEQRAAGIVIFAHGSGSSRHSPRNRFVAATLQEAGLGTLLIDLLTEAEERVDVATREHRFDVHLLASRVRAAADWLAAASGVHAGRIGLFGASTGAAAALICAAKRRDLIDAVVSRGGRPDLAGEALADVAARTLLIVGGADDAVIDLNREALAALKCEKRLEIIPGATHLFEEPGALEQVARLAANWFLGIKS